MSMMQTWNRFWFERRSTESLCLLRIFFGSVFLMKMTGFANLQRFLRLDMEFPDHWFNDREDYYLEVFRMPISGLEWLPVPEFWQYQTLEYILLFAGMFFVVGLFTRAAGITIASIWMYMFLLSQFTYRHHVMLIAIVMLVLACSRCDDHYSLRAFIRGKFHERPLRMILPIRLLQGMVSIIYLFSTMGKLNPSWFTGDIMLIFKHQGSVSGDFPDFLDWFFSFGATASLEEWFFRSLAWFTLFAEGFLIFGFWIPRLRHFAILIGLMLHLGIDLTMSVSTFSFQMFAVYTIFILPESRQHLAVYDGSTPAVLRRVNRLRLLDWFQRVRWVDASEAPAGTVPDTVSEADVSSGRIVVVGTDGRARTGYRALTWLFSRFPITFVPSWVMRLPGISWLGSRLVWRTA